MRINNNVMALNAHRQLGMNQTGASKSMERLSSGLRINRAGDDAAGLAISEKMRGQIRGLKQASRNAQDGISMIQTAEGALNETHAILQRMRELAVQASTDTNTLADRKEIQKEINQLLEEIDRIADNTEFNTKKLIDGSMSVTSAADPTTPGAPTAAGAVIHIGANQGQNLTIHIASMRTDALGGVAATTPTTPGTTTGGTAATGTIEVGGAAATVSATGTIGGSTGTITVTGGKHAAYDGIEITFVTGGAAGAVFDATTGITITLETGGGYSAEDINELIAAISDDAPDNVDFSQITVDFTGEATGEELADFDIFELAGGKSGVELAIEAGEENGELGNIEIVFAKGIEEGVAWDNNQLTITLDETRSDYTVAEIEALIQGATTDAPEGIDMSAFTVSGDGTINAADHDIDASVTLDGGVTGDGADDTDVDSTGRISSLKVSDADIDSVNTDAEAAELANAGVLTQSGADAAITNINHAIEQVSGERSKLGAYQNRLEHTISNLGTSAENLQASESRIRDLDMAEEIMAFTKNNILQQAATAMLAQANMAPQSVLQLLG